MNGTRLGIGREKIVTSDSRKDADQTGQKTGALLAPYRVLDLTDERGLMAGHLLAQLGADVIQVEPPEGSPARQMPPFADSNGQPPESLFWTAYAAGTRSIALAIDTDAGREQLLRLAAESDVLIESSPPGALAELGLGYEDLAKVNPRLIYVSISAYGSSGPKKDYVDSDLTVWAASGPLALTRAESGLPLRISIPQTFHQAATDAACGALMALMARGDDGAGQRVEVSAQASSTLCTLFGHLAAAVNHEDYSMGNAGLKKSELDLSGSGARTQKTKWEVRDGTVEMHIGIGTAAGRFSNALFAWLAEIGECPEEFAGWNWIELPQQIKADEVTMDQVDRARDHVGMVLARYTKNELVTIAEAKGLMLAPILTMPDLLESPQLVARNFFVPGSGSDERKLLPAPFNGCGVPAKCHTRAPAIGEQSDEVFEEYLGQDGDGSPTATSAGDATPASPVLEGLKVLDLAWVVAGPLVGRALADFGATVVRVESPKRVDTARILGPFPEGEFDPETSVGFENGNLNKLGMTLDLSCEEARQTVRDLAAWADVVIESFLPGQMEKFGLDYESLKQINPGIVMLSSSLTGQTGPTARLPGFGNIGAALSGMKQMVGMDGQLPIGPYGPYTDYVAPRFGLMALLSVLDRRQRTGEGCHLDISQVETAVTFLAPQLLDYQLSGHIASAKGNRDERFSPNGVFQAAGEDKWIAITVQSDEEWQRMASLVGGRELAADSRFTETAGRKTNEDALEKIVEQWTISRTPAEIETALQDIGIAAHRVADTYDIVADPQLAHRGSIVRLKHPKCGETVADAARFNLSETPARYVRHAPTFGQDNDLILTEILNYSSDRIETLKSSGALA